MCLMKGYGFSYNFRLNIGFNIYIFNIGYHFKPGTLKEALNKLNVYLKK